MSSEFSDASQTFKYWTGPGSPAEVQKWFCTEPRCADTSRTSRWQHVTVSNLKPVSYLAWRRRRRWSGEDKNQNDSSFEILQILKYYQTRDSFPAWNHRRSTRRPLLPRSRVFWWPETRLSPVGPLCAAAPSLSPTSLQLCIFCEIRWPISSLLICFRQLTCKQRDHSSLQWHISPCELVLRSQTVWSDDGWLRAFGDWISLVHQRL